MAIYLPGANAFVKFSAPTNALGLTSKTIQIWIKPDSSAAPDKPFFMVWDGTGTDSDEYWELGLIGSTTRIYFKAHFSTTDGRWSTSAGMTNGAWNLLTLRYDASSTANNPSVYFGSVSKTVTRDTAPVGTYRTGTTADLYIGAPASVSKTVPLCYLQDARIYTGIVGSSRISTRASSPSLEGDDASDLKFSAPLMYSANRYPTIPFASQLGPTDYLYDRISDYQGVGDQDGGGGLPEGSSDGVFSSGF